MIREIASWIELLQEKFQQTGDDFSKMVTTLSPEQLARKFDTGYGGHEGDAFTAWGDKYVYFPIVYDGAEWVGYAPRNPCDEAMNHQGGE